MDVAETLNTSRLPPVEGLFGYRWIDAFTGRARLLAAEHQTTSVTDELLQRYLAIRGVGPHESGDFLDPRLRKFLPDPSDIYDLDSSADRLLRAVLDRERVVIFSDYDVDGATSAALVFSFLRALGLKTSVVIPNRLTEGYGPNLESFKELVGKNVSLIVTLDCGSASVQPLSFAASAGVDVVVIDHHPVPDYSPEAVGSPFAFVNAHHPKNQTPVQDLCAAGLSFLLLVGLARAWRNRVGCIAEKEIPDLRLVLDLVALATVCDMVPLSNLNRAFIRAGLEISKNQPNIGLAALAERAELRGPITERDFGFGLGPRINAGGRLGQSMSGFQLLSSSSRDEASEIAAGLDRLNRERQSLQIDMLDDAMNLMSEVSVDPVIVLGSSRWHAGVVGLLAARLVEKIRKPVIAISFAHGEAGTGSGRSVAGLDLGAAITSARNQGIVLRGGGHSMAVGLSIDPGRLDDLRKFLTSYFSGYSPTAPELLFESTQRTESLDAHFVDSIERLGPFGQGNSRPIIRLLDQRLAYISVVGKRHIAGTLISGSNYRLRFIAFGAMEKSSSSLMLAGKDRYCHVLGTIGHNEYQGRTSVQLILRDITFL